MSIMTTFFHTLLSTQASTYIFLFLCSILQLDMVPAVLNFDKTVLGCHKNLMTFCLTAWLRSMKVLLNYSEQMPHMNIF